MGSLCLMMTKVVIGSIKIQNQKLKTLSTLADKTNMIELKKISKKRKEYIITYKIDKLEKAKHGKEIAVQNTA